MNNFTTDETISSITMYKENRSVWVRLFIIPIYA